MPKQTFFHLSKDKQEILIKSAKEEFSRVPLHDASIANIIKNAGIPRGSFYQYFEDKEDLYFYLLNQLSKKNAERFISILKEKDGDIFETFIESFQFMIRIHKNPEHKSFFKNAFLNMNYKLENTLVNNLYEESQKKQYFDIIHLINTKNLNIKDEKDLHQIMKIASAVTFHNLVHMFGKELSDEETLKNYIDQIELLKRGLYKEED
ncbi:TetR family transcriptional regulator [Heyndrickxia sporothermodurans]|uniref:TetR family transcriptional regulator n=1 Tax=Heyndrickxia sporothermodurans TaxID=46224 RepID=A0AB37HFH2_9BACI|nr:TetR/AcrR family transcriptional regulator [Heyndrickxia sporothermodurans]MBL5768832.1 TetR family transcriptional regulator [Heyndrickxia sporothermodurans]MBL5772588.1 TetR family transcriptional regulator [Heyndrickxia sporothermodurans]MBL5776487.1 TetR family transcriptional regulator [Heyndrickxia sporothermodurans]MBL5779624.1 TetR family transcriptional regulator [Heyndrickxia sporothermodurans]MBL5783180.1 TetR family transcriptional regulator [Heyndrickxia sporothermodurans]